MPANLCTGPRFDRSSEMGYNKSQFHYAVSSKNLHFFVWLFVRLRLKYHRPYQQIKIEAPRGKIYIFPCGCELEKGALSKELLPAGQEPSQIPKGRAHTCDNLMLLQSSQEKIMVEAMPMKKI